jgi:bifunctional non-homologous end joining protein LigD
MHDREQQPTFVAPMLLTSGLVRGGPEWALELKWDGCRAQLRYDRASLSLRTRNGRECSEAFPEVADIVDALGERRVTLDGELVCLRDDGRPDFAQLRRHLAGRAWNALPAMLQIFDVLHLDGCSTRALPYRERRGLLDELALDGPAWRTPTSIVLERPDDFIARVKELGLEGVVAKHLDSTYLPGRRSAKWVKHKLRSEEQLVVTGIRRSAEGRTEAVLVARRLPDGSIRPAGAVELGLRCELLDELQQRLAPLPIRRHGTVTWYPAEVSVIVSAHGPPDRPVRDAILRGVGQLS